MEAAKHLRLSCCRIFLGILGSVSFAYLLGDPSTTFTPEYTECVCKYVFMLDRSTCLAIPNIWCQNGHKYVQIYIMCIVSLHKRMVPKYFFVSCLVFFSKSPQCPKHKMEGWKFQLTFFQTVNQLLHRHHVFFGVICWYQVCTTGSTGLHVKSATLQRTLDEGS